MDREDLEGNVDSLYNFIHNQIHMYIKFKPDKWIKMISNEDHKVR